MSSKKDCPFCNIDARRNFIIEENNISYVTFSNPRKIKGQLLVIPKRHVEEIEKLTDGEWKSLIDLIVKYHKKIIDKISEGCDIRQHFMPYVKQGRLKVDHVHFHLMPRNFNDEFFEKTKMESELFEDLDKSEVDEVRKLLK